MIWKRGRARKNWSLLQREIRKTRGIGARLSDGVSVWSILYYPLISDITAVVAIAVIQVAFSSAVVSGDFKDQQDHFGVSAEVIALTVSLTVCGFGYVISPPMFVDHSTGPLAWSPLSELLGRRILWIFPFLVYIIFNIPCALAPNIGCLLVSRFLCGFFGSAPLTLAGGTISDIWGPEERGMYRSTAASAD